MNIRFPSTPYILLLSLISSGFSLCAQDKPCKPALKANRHKEVSVSDPMITGNEFRSGSFTFVTDYLAPNRNRVTVKLSNKPLTEFHTNGLEISDKVYHEYDLSGKLIMTDSLNRGKGRHKKTYMGTFSSSHVVSSTRHYPNGNPASCVYYSLKKGEDSVVKTWYSNRFPKSIQIKNYWHSDSVIVKWDSTGILRENTNASGSELYYPDGILMRKILPYNKWYYNAYGILEETSRDTMIAGMSCEQKKTFYPGGILKSVEYYGNGEPCHTWSFYTPEGVLKNKVKKAPVVPLEVGVGMVEAEYAPEFFTYVEQLPEYPGGDHLFRKHMERGMADLLCKSDIELSGVYKLKFNVNESGETVFVGLEGLNADKLASSFAGLFKNMVKWKPGKQNGRFMTVGFVIDINVKEKS